MVDSFVQIQIEGEAGYRLTNEDYKFFEQTPDIDQLFSQLKSIISQIKVRFFSPLFAVQIPLQGYLIVIQVAQCR